MGAMKGNIVLCAVALVLAGCSAHKPILYPNDHYRQVGAEAAESDIKTCMTLAEEAGASPSQGKTAQTATGTVAGGAIGSAAGAVGGAIVGRPGRGGDDRRGQRCDRRVSSRPVQEITAERGLYELRESLSARTRVRSDRMGVVRTFIAESIPHRSTISSESPPQTRCPSR